MSHFKTRYPDRSSQVLGLHTCSCTKQDCKSMNEYNPCIQAMNAFDKFAAAEKDSLDTYDVQAAKRQLLLQQLMTVKKKTGTCPRAKEVRSASLLACPAVHDPCQCRAKRMACSCVFCLVACTGDGSYRASLKSAVAVT